VPGPAPPVVRGLQIDQSLDFQRRFGRVQRWAWRLLALLPVAAVLGLFGGGLLSQVTAGSPGGEVTYDRFGRLSVDSELDVTVGRTRGPVVVSVSRGLLDGCSITEVRPQPERVTASADRLQYVFAATPGASVSFSVQPQRLGSVGGTVAVGGGPPVRVHQLIYP
jgi:hypothetical protein